MPALRNGFMAPLSLPVLMQQLQQYLLLAKHDLLQPRQQVIDRLLKEIQRL